MPTNSTFDLIVDFSGLFLFHKRKPDSGHQNVSVLVPDGRDPTRHPKKLMVQTSQGKVDIINGGENHVDGTPTRPHAGYLRIPMAHLVDPAPSDGEAVIRLDRQEIGFGWPQGSGSSDVDFAGLDDVADFNEIAPTLKIDDTHTEDPTPPKVLLARLRADRGAFTTRLHGSGWGFSGHLRKDGKAVHKPPRVARVMRWKVSKLSGSQLPLLLEGLDGSSKDRIDLIPRKGQIHLTLGNLCSDNPLEWDEFGDAPPEGDEDRDFRWLYNLMTPDSLATMLDDLKGYKVPVPTLTQGAQGSTSMCLPGGGGP